MKFCPVCGKKGIEGDFCSSCQPLPDDIKFKDIHVKVCASCSKYFLSNNWKPAHDLDEAIIRVARKRIKTNKDIIIVPEIPDVKHNPGVDTEITLDIDVDGDEFSIPAKLSFTLCDKCGKAGTQYFEGILQVRNPDDALESFIRKRLEDAEKRGVFANKILEVKNGVDYYMSDKRFLRRLGKELKKNFKGELKESAQLFSRDKQTSKDIFRLNVLFRREE